MSASPKSRAGAWKRKAKSPTPLSSLERIDPQTLYPVRYVPKLVPGKPHISTVTRWTINGIRGPNGERRLLKSQRVGAQRFVLGADLIEFLSPRSIQLDRGSSSESQMAAAKAGRELAKEFRIWAIKKRMAGGASR